MKRALLAALACLAVVSGAQAQCLGCGPVPIGTDTVIVTQRDRTSFPTTLNSLPIDGSSITGVLSSAHGGTGLSTFTADNNAIYSTSASVLAAGTLPVAAGGTGSTTQNFVDLSTTQASIAGTKTFTDQLIGKGTATNDNAAAGYIGEVIEVTWSGVSLTNSTPVTIAALTVTAGDWDIFGGGTFTASGGSISGAQFGASTTAATIGAAGTYAYVNGVVLALGLPTQRFSFASTTTVYIVGNIGFTGTATSSGKAYVRRAR